MGDSDQVWAVVVEYHGGSPVVVARKFANSVLRKLDKVFDSSSAEGVRVLLLAKGKARPGEFDDHTEEGWSVRVSRPKWYEKLFGSTLQRRIEREIAQCTRWCEERNREAASNASSAKIKG